MNAWDRLGTAWTVGGVFKSVSQEFWERLRAFKNAFRLGVFWKRLGAFKRSWRVGGVLEMFWERLGVFGSIPE